VSDTGVGIEPEAI